MRVCVYEYACVVGDAIALPASIRAEGRAMLEAVVGDFARLPSVEVQTMSQNEEGAFRDSAASFDWWLIIAPEFDGLLFERCHWIEESGGRLLGPSSEAVRLAGDKWATHQLLCRAGVPTPHTRLASDSVTHAEKGRFVAKPRCGAGSQDVRVVNHAGDVAASESVIVQEYVQGVHASVAFLVGPRGLVPMLPGYQLLSDDGHFRYVGGRIPLRADLAERAVRLGRRALETLPGLCGYLGVDLVLGESEQRDFVVEINPRLTTSYVGLRALAEGNLAATMLEAASGRTPVIQWRPGNVDFKPTGEVLYRPAPWQ